MKDIPNPLLRILPLALMLALLCCSCFTTYDTSAEVDGYTVDFQTGQITDGENVYEFKWSGDEDEGSATVILPGGASTSLSWNREIATGGASGSIPADQYELASKLPDIVRDALHARKNPPVLPALPILLIGIGALQIAYPQIDWYLTTGWKIKDAEPSNATLVVGRITGGLLVFIGVILFFVKISGR